MSYNQKPPGASGSGMGGGPPNGPNNMPQVAKTFAGIQQQMQNLVHGQNAIPQSSQADINAFLQQQRIQNMLKQQQQFLQFQHQMQQQQQQQQQHQHHNMPGGGGVGGGPVGGVTGVGGVAGTGGGGPGVSGEPLALTRTPGAAELLNKTYQQQANGNPAANPTFNQLQQTLQALPQNFVQQLQVFQYQMQAKQMQQQQQHGGGQPQHGHGQQQPVQGVPPPPVTTAAMSHQQQQQQQKHQNQHQQQQQQAAFSRYLTAAAAQAAAVSGNKMSAATPPPPPPLTNQMKPPNLPPNTQITPVTAANIGNSGNLSAGLHPKISTGIPTTVSNKHQAPPPSISLTPSKTAASSPSAAHQQNKFTPPSNAGSKGGHLGHAGHSQNPPKSTHGANTVTSNTTSPAKSGTNTDASAAALKSPQSTPVQLTKQIPPTATAAATGSKNLASATTTAAATITMVSPHKSTTSTVATHSAANTTSTTTVAAAANVVNITSAASSTIATNVTQAKSSATKSNTDDLAGSKIPLKSLNIEKEASKTSSSNESNKPLTDLKTTAKTDTDSKTETTKVENDKKSDASLQQKSLQQSLDAKERPQQTGNDLKPTSATSTMVPPDKIEIKEAENKTVTTVESNKPDLHDTEESKKKLEDAKSMEKDKISTSKFQSTVPIDSSVKETVKKSETPTDNKKPLDDVHRAKDLNEEKKTDCKAEIVDKEKKLKVNKSNKVELENTASKDIPIPIPETESDKSNTAVDRKTSTSTKTISAKPLGNDKLKALDATETNNKKETSESAQQKTDEKKSTPPPGNNAEFAKEMGDDKLKKEEKEVKAEAEAPQNKGEQIKSTKSNEKAETVTVSKSVTTNNTIAEKTLKEATEVAKKDSTTAVAATPVKKIGRQYKGAKSKLATSAIPADSKTSDSQEDKPATTNVRVKRKSKAAESTASESAPSTPKEDDSDRKSKRHRLKTILYQSPLPELAYITKLSASEASNSPKPMSNEDRLIVFYKNEYMAVRNAEGTFYLCQTMQNVYRTSPRISIRWLSEDAKDNNVFIPDFYDHTDIECVLTTVELKRIDKGHLRLPKPERSRIESILKKAIDVEKGLLPRPELTEENPDGLDISLFKDESQIEKKSALNEGGENQTPSTTTGRKSRRGNTLATASARKSNASATTPSTSASGNKRKRGSSTAPASSSRKTQPKKRKTLTKRRRKTNNSDDEDDDESSEDNESDTEYKPTQKRSSLNTSGVSKSTPRAQRSPLAKARAASPITPTTSRSKNVPQKTTPTPSTSKASRGERAAKRKSVTDGGSSEEAFMPVKKPTTTSNNKSKASAKISNEITIGPLKKSSSSSSLINNSKIPSDDITTNSIIDDAQSLSLSTPSINVTSSINNNSQSAKTSENSGDVPASGNGGTTSRTGRSRK